MIAIIGGKFKKRRLSAPKSEHIRPTTSQVRETVFNICQTEIEGAHFLDLFAGSGAIGFEALSRGAAHVTFVDNNRLALEAIRKNISHLQIEKHCRILSWDFQKSLHFLYEKKELFQLIYADPPYGKELGKSILAFLDSHHLLESNGSLFIEDEGLSVPALHNLQLYTQRKIGRAHLFHFKNRNISDNTELKR